jgi:hypothetical protein
LLLDLKKGAMRGGAHRKGRWRQCSGMIHTRSSEHRHRRLDKWRRGGSGSRLEVLESGNRGVGSRAEDSKGVSVAFLSKHRRKRGRQVGADSAVC